MNLRVEASLDGSIAARAHGRLLVIDSFRTWSCGTWIGDLTVEWWRSAPGDDFVEAAAIEGVAVFIRRRLTRVLETAGVTIARSRLPLFGGLRIELDRPELWIDYLDRPLAWSSPTMAHEGWWHDNAPSASDGTYGRGPASIDRRRADRLSPRP